MRSMQTRIIGAAIGVAIGLSAALVFAAKFQAIRAAILAFVKTALCVVCLMEHLRRKTAQAEGRIPPSRATFLNVLAVVAGAGSLISFLAFLIGDSVNHAKLTAQSGYVASIMAFLAFGWSLTMYYYSTMYGREDKTGVLISAVVPVPLNETEEEADETAPLFSGLPRN